MDRLVSAEWLAGHLHDPGLRVFDATVQVQRRLLVRRPGHIPGSRNVTAWEILDRETQRYRELPELRGKVGPALDAEQIITYCGAGAAASSLAHVLVRLGHPGVAVYDGGLLEWCADRRFPLELGT